MNSQRLSGTVAQILNDRELVINVGLRDGVQQGMRFAVLSREPLEVRDPTSGEVLGVIDREKIRVEATDVEDRYTICATYEWKTVGGSLGISGLYEALSPRRVPTTFKATEFPEPLTEEESYVKVGDRVREVVPDPARVTTGNASRS